MLNYLLSCLMFLSLIYDSYSKHIGAKNVIHAVNTVARDYRNAKIANEGISSRVDKLSSRITDISKIFSAKIAVKEDDTEGWKSIEQELYSGLVLLLNSCETKNVKGYLLGSLKISSALVAVTGIHGSLDAAILDTVGYSFDIFGSVFEGRNPTKDAFQEFQDVGMDLDFKEAKFYFENILNPVVVNPDIDKLIKKPYDRIVEDWKCCRYSENEMIEILRIHQKPLHLYSKVSSLLQTFCSNEVMKKIEGSFAFSRCLTVLKQYCEISKTHQAFLLRVLSSIRLSNVTDNMIYVHKILFHVKGLFKRDKTTLGFLFNPMESYHTTKVMFEVHLNRTEFKDVLDHTEVLHKKFNLYSNNTIVLCRQKELRGLCHEMDSTIASKNDVKSWKFKPINDWTEAHSMFIPPHIKVEFMTSDIDIARNRPHSYHGPFKGLAVYSSEESFDLRNIKISVESIFKEDPETRICTANGWCDTFSDDTKSFRSIHGIDMSQSLLKSIEIPDGTLLKLLTADGSIIPLIGPFSTADLDKCKVWSWSQIVQIKKVLVTGNSVTKSDVLYEANTSSEDVKADEDVSKGSEIQVLTKVKRITDVEYTKEERTDMLVVVCTRPYLKGFCIQYDSDYVSKGTFSTFQQLFKTECKLGMQSMRIPAGVKVIGYQKVDGKFSAFGPYIGPTIIDKLDYGAEYRIEVSNMFKNSKSLSSIIKPKYRTSYM